MFCDIIFSLQGQSWLSDFNEHGLKQCGEGWMLFLPFSNMMSQNIYRSLLKVLLAWLTGPVGNIRKSIGCVSCASVKECMQTTIRFSKVAYFRALSLRLAQTLHRTLNDITSIQMGDQW